MGKFKEYIEEQKQAQLIEYVIGPKFGNDAAYKDIGHMVTTHGANPSVEVRHPIFTKLGHAIVSGNKALAKHLASKHDEVKSSYPNLHSALMGA